MKNCSRELSNVVCYGEGSIFFFEGSSPEAAHQVITNIDVNVVKIMMFK